MWYWYLLIIILAILVLWWALTRQASFTEVPAHSHSEHDDSHDQGDHSTQQVGLEHKEMPVLETRVEPTAIQSTFPDDLKIIEGIGPKIASILISAGISTFSELGVADPQKIKTILSSADERLGRISDPTTWPEQARLAAKGDMDGLVKLQKSLKGGRQN